MALTNESCCKVINVGSDKQICILEFSKMVSIVTGSSISFNLQVIFHTLATNSLFTLIGDINNYNWSPKVDILDGINSTVN